MSVRIWTRNAVPEECCFSLSVSHRMVSDSCQGFKILFNVVFFISLKQSDLEDERSKLQQQILSEKHEYDQKVTGLESQIAALEAAWEFDKTAAQHKIVSTETVQLAI